MQLATNPHAERAALALVFQLGDCEKLWILDDSDFADPANKFLLSELNALVASGAPLSDATACATWFSSPAAKERAKSIREDNLPHLAADTFGQEVIAAHWDYYLGLLRAERLRRTLQTLTFKLQEKVERAEPDATLVWLAEQVERIRKTSDSVCAPSS
jgi:replicative DNA helicase